MSFITPNFLGCSFVLHALAGHPKVALVAGLVTAFTFVSNPSGTTVKAGADSILRAVESRQVARMTTEQIAQMESAIKAEDPAKVRLSGERVQYVLDQFGCRDCSASDVMADQKLMISVATLYWADLLHRYGGNVTVAKAVLGSPTK